jgi:hypothetical protein
MILTDVNIWKQQLKSRYNNNISLIFNDKIDSIGKYCSMPLFENNGIVHTVKSYVYENLDDLSDIDILHRVTTAKILHLDKLIDVYIVICIKK